ncbi:hypothetical protein G6O69_17115 [Pseudenhygromyxa sp. WMMC2535]|uniref:hypothetical protein n=1 Tax=Pseudenhygromyxa sp. WMMC2535 TaxID=2712867 RepID=UPI001553F0B4|nr:hypothetical protein [Pseudenhygromyxa sp. WMMC2535]NVB39566.1 hypothetical protein [Pseudenhygromyxa sp. WMMC2535]
MDWYLVARADVPRAIDTEARLDFFVEAPPEVQAEVVGEEVITHESLMAKSKHVSMNYVILAFVLMLVFGVASIIGIALRVPEGQRIYPATGGSALLLLSLFLVWLEMKKTVARHGFTRLNSRFARIDATRVATELDWFSPTVVNEVTVALVAEERATSGVGTNKSGFYAKVHGAIERQPIGRAGAYRLHLEFDLPELREIGWSLEVKDNQLVWYVALEFDVESGPELDEQVPLRVRPVLGPAQ